MCTSNNFFLCEIVFKNDEQVLITNFIYKINMLYKKIEIPKLYKKKKFQSL